MNRSETRDDASAGGAAADPVALVDDSSLVLRNYDGLRAREIRVRFLGVDDELAFRRTFSLDPGETTTVETRLRRGVYLVEATLEDGATDRAECLVGSGADETAYVETGNGVVSVAEGVF